MAPMNGGTPTAPAIDAVLPSGAPQRVLGPEHPPLASANNLALARSDAEAEGASYLR